MLKVPNKCLVCMIIRPTVCKEWAQAPGKQHSNMDTIYEGIIVESGKILLWNSHQLYNTEWDGDFDEYIPLQAPVVIMLLNFKGKLTLSFDGSNIFLRQKLIFEIFLKEKVLQFMQNQQELLRVANSKNMKLFDGVAGKRMTEK